MILFIKIVHVVTCILFLIPAVLIQSGKGAEISASFGGSSQTVFGTAGGANFLVRITYAAAAVFMVTSLSLTILGSREQKSLFEGAPAAQTAPAQTGTTPAVPAPQAAPTQPAAPAPAQPAGTPGK